MNIFQYSFNYPSIGIGMRSTHLSNIYIIHFLVGGIPTPLKKYAFVNWDDDIPNL